MNNPNEAVLLTEDGHPIGELVVADGCSVPAPVTDRSISENRAELLKSAVVEMTGDPDADTAIAERYPGYTDPDLRRKALDMYVTQPMSVDEVAERIGVPGRTVSMWAYVGKWDELVRREIAARQSRSVLELARLRADRRVQITREQLDQAKELRESAMKQVRSGDTSIKSGTEAWAAAAKVEHTLTGVSEAGTIADIDGSERKGGEQQAGKTPFLVVFNGGLAPVRRPGQ